MRLSNLEEGSYNNTPEPKKMQVTVADKKANTEAWKRYQAGDSRYEFKNPTTEAEVQVDNAGNIAGYLDTIDEYVEQVFQIDDQSRPEDIKEMAYRIQNAVDDIRTRELGLKPSNIRSQYNEGKSPHKKGTAKYKKHMAAMHAESKDEVNEEHDIGLLKAVARQMEADAHKGDYTAIEELLQDISTEELKAFLSDHRDINEFGPDERYMKIGNNTMIANKKTGSVSSTLNLGGDKTATVNNHLNKDGSAGKISASGTVNGVKFKASNNITGTAPKASASMRGVTINASKEPKVREAGSPWTTTGKHPEKMTVDELWAEIAVFDHIQDRGERLSPKDMMRLDSLFSYMDTAEMNEAIHRKADSMMESAVWKAKKNK